MECVLFDGPDLRSNKPIGSFKAYRHAFVGSVYARQNVKLSGAVSAYDRRGSKSKFNRDQLMEVNILMIGKRGDLNVLTKTFVALKFRNGFRTERARTKLAGQDLEHMDHPLPHHGH